MGHKGYSWIRTLSSSPAERVPGGAWPLEKKDTIQCWEPRERPCAPSSGHTVAGDAVVATRMMTLSLVGTCY